MLISEFELSLDLLITLYFLPRGSASMSRSRILLVSRLFVRGALFLQYINLAVYQ